MGAICRPSPSQGFARSKGASGARPQRQSPVPCSPAYHQGSSAAAPPPLGLGPSPQTHPRLPAAAPPHRPRPRSAWQENGSCAANCSATGPAPASAPAGQLLCASVGARPGGKAQLLGAPRIVPREHHAAAAPRAVKLAEVVEAAALRGGRAGRQEGGGRELGLDVRQSSSASPGIFSACT